MEKIIESYSPKETEDLAASLVLDVAPGKVFANKKGPFPDACFAPKSKTNRQGKEA